MANMMPLYNLLFITCFFQSACKIIEKNRIKRTESEKYSLILHRETIRKHF